MRKTNSVNDVREKVLEIADDLHADYKAEKNIKVVGECLKALNISISSSKAQLVYGKLCGFGSNVLPFLEPNK